MKEFIKKTFSFESYFKMYLEVEKMKEKNIE